ncbi:MAG: hypothetical protein V4635_04075 [Bacteroidota bacterium]
MSQQLKTMLELAFIDGVDGNFPYSNRKECLKLIDEAIGISPNCVFAVVEEIGRIPDEEREQVPFLQLTELLKLIEKKFDHPMKATVLKVARRMLNQEETPVEEVVANMEALKKFPRQFAALNIFYYSSFDESGKRDEAWDGVIREWDNASGV